MKILLYTHGFAPVIGGVETYAAQFAEGLTNFRSETGGQAFSVTLVTATAAGGFDDSRSSFRIVRCPRLWHLLRLIREADLVHLAGPCMLPLVIAYLIRKPVVITHHGYQSICPNGLLFKQPLQSACPGHFMKRQVSECLRCCAHSAGVLGGLRSVLLTFPRRWLCKRIAANVAVTNHVGGRIRLPRTRTIYHGIDVAGAFNSQSAVGPSGIVEFAYVGRLVSEKGLPLLLQAAKHLADQKETFRLTLIGDGPERARLERATKELGLDVVKFRGTLRGAALERALSDVAVVVMPSIWEETAGLAAIEHMMRGRLVIVADIGGLAEVVGDTGLKFKPGDWRSLALCMQTVLDDPMAVSLLGSSARTRAIGLFSRDRMIEDHAALDHALVCD